MKSHTVNNQCRICRSHNLVKFLDLGEQSLANSFLHKDNLAIPEPKYPLAVFFCADCGLSQLVDIVSPEILFRDYVYFSSGMPSSPHFKRYADEVADRFISSPQDLVVEIGSNDGHLLREFKERGARILGVDPARNIAARANENGIPTIPEFFTETLARDIAQEHGHARVIIGNNVVAHIDDHHDLVRGVSALLAPSGVFIFEAPYLVDMFENLTFDTVYHEHMSYLSVRPLMHLFAQYGMEIFDAKTVASQGNSLRVFACKKGMRGVDQGVQVLVQKELEMGLDTIDAYHDLARKVGELKKEVISVVSDFKRQGKRIAGYGAPAKGNTLLNYFGMGPEMLSYATESLPSKIGLHTPGMHIPVVDIEEARKNPPDYYVMLAWNYKDVILQKEAKFLEQGGKFIMPVGSTRIVS
ncbi:MAG: class I SAM-dependent methyltransferase [bacterium]|nr:class I SAM-dependent methyltransferase [bacterium]